MICLQTFGIDISSYSKEIDWKKVIANLAPKFVFARASYMHANPLSHSAQAHSDVRFNGYWSSLGSLHLLRGAYVYCHPWGDPNDTVTEFFRVYKPTNGDLLPALDIEDNWEDSSGVPQADRVRAIDTMIRKVSTRIGGQMPIIYTHSRVWNDLGNPAFDGCPLWVVDYRTLPTLQNMPQAWTSFAFWQYAENLKIDGVGGDYDANLFNGSEDELVNYVIQ